MERASSSSVRRIQSGVFQNGNRHKTHFRSIIQLPDKERLQLLFRIVTMADLVECLGGILTQDFYEDIIAAAMGSTD